MIVLNAILDFTYTMTVVSAKSTRIRMLKDSKYCSVFSNKSNVMLDLNGLFLEVVLS